MKKLLKILNPFIWLLNLISYFGHMENYRGRADYKPYNFEKDIKYF